MNNSEAVILIGHGGVPKDLPRNILREFKRLESDRESRKSNEMSHREAELDHTIRHWPRSPETDPYQQGLEIIAKKLQPLLNGKKLVVAYNEFCHPSIQAAFDQLVSRNFKNIKILTTMFTPGGSHAEFEIPQVISQIKEKYPDVQAEYAWPYKMEDVAELLAQRLKQMENTEVVKT